MKTYLFLFFLISFLFIESTELKAQSAFHEGVILKLENLISLVNTASNDEVAIDIVTNYLDTTPDLGLREDGRGFYTTRGYMETDRKCCPKCSLQQQSQSDCCCKCDAPEPRDWWTGGCCKCQWSEFAVYCCPCFVLQL